MFADTYAILDWQHASLCCIESMTWCVARFGESILPTVIQLFPPIYSTFKEDETTETTPHFDFQEATPICPVCQKRMGQLTNKLGNNWKSQSGASSFMPLPKTQESASIRIKSISSSIRCVQKCPLNGEIGQEFKYQI